MQTQAALEQNKNLEAVLGYYLVLRDELDQEHLSKLAQDLLVILRDFSIKLASNNAKIKH